MSRWMKLPVFSGSVTTSKLRIHPSCLLISSQVLYVSESFLLNDWPVYVFQALWLFGFIYLIVPSMTLMMDCILMRHNNYECKLVETYSLCFRNIRLKPRFCSLNKEFFSVLFFRFPSQQAAGQESWVWIFIFYALLESTAYSGV